MKLLDVVYPGRQVKHAGIGTPKDVRHRQGHQAAASGEVDREAGIRFAL